MNFISKKHLQIIEESLVGKTWIIVDSKGRPLTINGKCSWYSISAAKKSLRAMMYHWRFSIPAWKPGQTEEFYKELEDGLYNQLITEGHVKFIERY